MGGLLGPLQGVLMGSAPKARKSGAFQNLEELGTEASSYLTDRLRQPASESTQYQLGSEAIREALSRTSRGARQRLGDTATTRGFMDSGAVLDASGDIDRAELEAFGASLRDLILGLEDRRMQGVLPYLSGGAQENLGIQGINVQSESQANQLMMDFLAMASGETRSYLSGGLR